MSIVTKRSVTRYYYKGKGFGSLYWACYAIAKDRLKDELYGPVAHDGPADDDYYGRPAFRGMSSEEAEAEAKRIFVCRFCSNEYNDYESRLRYRDYMKALTRKIMEELNG